MTEAEQLQAAIAEAASDWRDPEHPPREAAVEAALEAENRFTAEAVAFALNQRMAALTPEALADWLGDAPAASSADALDEAAAPPVVVRHDATEPLAGLRAVLAALLAGRPALSLLDPAAPHLLPAFFDDVADRLADRAPGAALAFRAEVLPEDAGAEDLVEALPSDAAAFVAAARDGEDLAALRAAAASAEVAPARRLLRPPRYAVAVLDGSETDDDLEALAEDALLHEGRSRRAVRVVWAPEGTSPDRLLTALAGFRGVFPAHPRTPGSLQMPQAFLKARGRSHAYGEGLEFLLSRGDPEPQSPGGHLRWAEYDALADVQAWLADHADEVLAVAARPSLARRFGDGAVPARDLGTLHRRALADELEVPSTVAFLRERDD